MLFRAINNYPYAFALSAKQNSRLIRSFRKRSTLRFVALRVEIFCRFLLPFQAIVGSRCIASLFLNKRVDLFRLFLRCDVAVLSKNLPMYNESVLPRFSVFGICCKVGGVRLILNMPRRK